MLKNNKIFKVVFITHLFFISAWANANNFYTICIDNQELKVEYAALNLSSVVSFADTKLNTNKIQRFSQTSFADSLFKSGELYLKLKPNVSINILFSEGKKIHSKELQLIIAKYNITKIEHAFRLKELQLYYKIKFKNKEQTAQLIAELSALSFVEFAERVPKHRTFLTPNDINAQQYNVQKVSAELAWDISTGNKNIKLAIVDDAVLIGHEDLSDNVLVNLAESGGTLGVDDDNNGYIDDITGWDAADDDNNPNPPATANENLFSHGTHCAGIAAGVTNNGKGMASISFNVSLIPVKTTHDDTQGPSIDNGFGGVEYAIAANADVISMSWGGGPPAQTEQDVFNLAHSKGIVLVAAAGNDNTSTFMYPASYEHVICVAATDDTDTRADFSNYGDSIDVAAPGVDIYSSIATNNQSYTEYSGTSMACPFVAGLCALMLSKDPNLPPSQVEFCLESTADNIDTQNPTFIGALGAGRVNAQKALLCLQTEPYAQIGTNFIGSACANKAIQFTDKSFGTDIDTWKWSFPGGNPATSNIQNPLVTYAANGNYIATLIVSNPYGSDTATLNFTIGPPSAIMSCDTTIFGGYAATLHIYLQGTPPWNLTYTDGATNTPLNNITQSPLKITVFPNNTTSYSVVNIADSQCNGLVQGNCTITVDNTTPCTDCPFYLVNDIFLGGNCITASNVSFTGATEQLGYFETAANLDVGFAKGIMLVTGPKSVVYAPNDSPGAGEDNGQPGDSDLDNISNAETHNAAVLEFDFTPSNDTVTFNYIFASEEYTEFVNAGFNDVFAFFISGPGIAGLKNIALIPGTNTPVSIDNVNNLAYPQYYVDNEFNNAVACQFDGLTTPLTAKATGLTPCETYHIKLAIADAGDGILDSGVFLEANSFNDGSKVDVGSIGTKPGTKEMQEGCKNGQFIFYRKDLSTINNPYVINITVGGTATMGIDYSAFPTNTVTIPAGDTSVVISIEAFLDGMAENPETVTIYLDDVQCGCTSTQLQATLILFDNQEVDAGGTVKVCKGDPAQLLAVGANSFNWKPAQYLNDPTIFNPIANVTQNTWFTVEAIDQYGCTSRDSVLVFVAELPYYEPISLDTTVCTADTVHLQLSNLSKIADNQYIWTPTTGLDNPNDPKTMAHITQTTTYTLTITNQVGCQTNLSLTINIQNADVSLNIPDTTICAGNPVTLIAGNFDAYAWSTGQTTSNINVLEAGNYTVTVTDNNVGCSGTAGVNVSQYPAVSLDITGQTQFYEGTTTTLTGTTGFATYNWSTGASTNFITASETGTYYLNAIDLNGCKATDSITIEKLVNETFTIPSAFSPNQDGINDAFGAFSGAQISAFNIQVFNRWGVKVFEANNINDQWDGTYKNIPGEIGVYTYTGNLTLANGKIIPFKGNVTLIK